jgi:isopropylmalate/homocitrate/citramalate synthase
MRDIIRDTALAGHLVIWEEAARDGAQAKTLMTGPQRVALARAHGAMFGEHGPNHLIFATGFPSICQEEFEAIRQVVAEVDNCSLASHGRATREDIDLGIAAMQGARYGRVTFFFPVSERMSKVLLHKTPKEVFNHGLSLARYALDRASGLGLEVDITLADASRADVNFVAEAIAALAEEGIGVIKVCDSVGEFYPHQSRQFYTALMEKVPANVALGIHNHNDLGFAVANNLEAIRAGMRVVATSWLGIAERNGLASTEQLLFSLAHEPQKLAERLGFESNFWLTPPDLKQLAPLARQVSQHTGVPLKVTDPIVGTGVNTISTGTPFIAPEIFQPFDPEVELGIPRQVVLTHLASARVITALTDELGYELTKAQMAAVVNWVKTETYRRGQAVISKEEFASFLAGLLALTNPEEIALAR